MLAMFVRLWLPQIGTGRARAGRDSDAPGTLGGGGPDWQRRTHPHRADSRMVKAALDQWTTAAGVTEGRIFRAVARMGKVWGKGISQNVVWYVVKSCCERAGLEHIAPHDLRRTCAKLCHTSGGEIEQIQFLLGHASVQTTEHYLGCKQNLGHPVNDLFRLGNIDAATYVVLAGTAVLKVKPESAQPDKMSDDEGSGNQEGSDEGASAGFHGDGHPSV